MTERLPSRLLLAPDARAAERELLAEVEAVQANDRFARVTIVVPSHRLRLHVLALLARGGRARLGVQVLTLRALAGAIVARAGDPAGDVEAGEALFELLAARSAADERALSKVLAPLDDGYAGVAASVSDLVDAGFGPEHLEEAGELLLQEGAALGGGAIDRALAILRLAARIPGELAATGAALESARTAAATEAVIADPERSLPAVRVLVHGVSDATGVASDLLQAIFRRLPTTVLLPVPSPLDERDGTSWRFGQRLRERFEGMATAESIPPFDDAGSGPFAFSAAPDLEREAREASDACAAAIDAGVEPERLAIVARDLAPYRSAFERAIDRRALPASGSGGGEHPAAAFARAWLTLLERGAESPLELLLAGVGRDALGGGARRPWQLRRESAERGLRRLGQIVVASSEARGPELARIAPPLRRIVRELEALARKLPLGEAGTRIARLLEDAALPGEVRERLTEPLALLSRPAASALSVEPRELRALLLRLWAHSGERPLGGEGGGVALLSVTEARSLSFDRLRIAGLSRDRFPRRVRTDPFLPDALRARLRTLLPDLPVKGEGHDEERFLFAQLLVAAPLVELSAPVRDADGRELPRSSLLDELDRAGRLAGAAKPAPPRRPAIELATAEALHGGGLGAHHDLALVETSERFGEPVDAAAAALLARQTRRLLVELAADPADARRRERLGPFFGFVGEPLAGDRRLDRTYVTSLEALARCGWKMFLERLLRLKPPPSTDEEIPSLPPRLAGLALHAFLERLAPESARGVLLAAAIAQPPVEIAWPASDAELERRLEEAAVDVLRADGIDAELFAPALTRAARELALAVRDLDWSAGARSTLAVESEGEAEIRAAGGSRTLRFRVDRVERVSAAGNGEILLLTDYKSGKPVSEAKKAVTRDNDLAKSIAQGKNLQLVAYALARLDGASRLAGRLLFARPDIAEDCRDVRAVAGDLALDHAPWPALFAARDLGAFVPRLVGTDLRTTFEGCSSCEVRVACVQGDSGARLRFERWASRGERADERDEGPAEIAARVLFELHPPRRKMPAPDAAANPESGEQG